MRVAAFCSPTHLKIVVGTGDFRVVRVDGFGIFPLPEGAMINGIITDEDAMIRFLSNVGKKMEIFKKETHLVIDTNNIRSKVMDLPIVPEQKALEFVSQELASYSETETEDIFDYAVLSGRLPTGGARVLGVAVDQNILQVYRDTFISAGFNLKSIDVGVNTLIKFTRILPQLSKGAQILAVADDRSLSLSLFEDGCYKITNKYRMTSAADTPDWSQEIGNNLSSMIQFHKGQRSDEEISGAFFAGLSPAKVDSLVEPLSFLGIGIHRLNLAPHIKYTVRGSKRKRVFLPDKVMLNLGALLKN